MKDCAAIVLRDGKNVLFVKRSEEKKILPGLWAFPSGTVENEDGIKETAIREAKEELGINAIVEDILHTTELPEFGVRLHFVICTFDSDKPSIQEPAEIQELR